MFTEKVISKDKRSSLFCFHFSDEKISFFNIDTFRSLPDHHPTPAAAFSSDEDVRPDPLLAVDLGSGLTVPPAVLTGSGTR